MYSKLNMIPIVILGNWESFSVFILSVVLIWNITNAAFYEYKYLSEEGEEFKRLCEAYLFRAVLCLIVIYLLVYGA